LATRTSQPLRIDAQPGPLTIDAAKTAVLVVDMQNDFGAEGGMFHRAGIDIAPIRAAVAPTARVLAAARAATIPVIYLKMEFRPDLTDAGAPDSPNRRKHAPLGIGTPVSAPGERKGRILVRDTWNTDIVPELAPAPGDILVSKHRYSGFFETDLDMILRSLDTTALVITGCTTSVCVESTIRDAMFRDYTCLLLTDCTAEPVGHGLPRSNHDASLLVIETLFGWTATSNAFIAALGAKG
jgi:ureidoacrylate peracid hydrolase